MEADGGLGGGRLRAAMTMCQKLKILLSNSSCDMTIRQTPGLSECCFASCQHEHRSRAPHLLPPHGCRPPRCPSCPQPFVPSLPAEVMEAWLQDVQQRAAVGSAAEAAPSCCFFTFVNTKQALTCASFTRDASRVAGGTA